MLPEFISFKQRMINRAKALGQLTWPFLIIVAVAFLSSVVSETRKAPAVENVDTAIDSKHAGWLAVDTASSLGASVSVTQTPQVLRAKDGTATTVTVTTYTVLGTF